MTLEAIDVPTDRLLWQTTVTAKADDLIGLQEQLSTQVQHGLLPILGGAAGAVEAAASRPKNQQAYDFYLRSVAVPHDPAPNKEAIKMLEWAVGIDPTLRAGVGSAGAEILLRFDLFGGGGEEMFQRSNAAYERAVSLDPNRMMAASNLITNRVERGELGRAYDAATDLVRRRPQSADAHFALSYVLRYAGMLEQSTQECNTARQLDPGNFSFPLVRLVVPGDGQDGSGDGLRASGCGLGVGGVGDSVCIPGRGQCGGGAGSARRTWGRRPTYHRELMEACTAAQRPRGLGEDCARERIVGR